MEMFVFWLLSGFGVLCILAQVGHGLETYLMNKTNKEVGE